MSARIKLVIISSLLVFVLLFCAGKKFYSSKGNNRSEDAGGDFLVGGREKREKDRKDHSLRALEPNQRQSPSQIALPSSLTPEIAKGLFEDYKREHPKLLDRIVFSKAIMRKLCELGYDEGAYGLIDSSFGGVRSGQIEQFFATAKLPASEIFKKLEGSDYPSDNSDAIRGYLSRFRAKDIEGVFSSPEYNDFLNKLDPKYASTLKSNVSSFLRGGLMDEVAAGSPREIQDIMTVALELNSKGLLNSSDFIATVDTYKDASSFDKWNWIVGMDPGGKRGEDARQLRNQMIDEMIKDNAPQALESILRGDNRLRNADLNSAIPLWINTDSQGATEWYTKNRSSLLAADNDSVVGAFFQQAFIAGEYAGAQKWVAEIRDPKLRDETLKLINEKISESEKVK